MPARSFRPRPTVAALWVLLVACAPLLADERLLPDDRFAGFPPIRQHRPGTRTAKVITSDAVSGLVRPKWTRAMTDLGAWPVMFRFRNQIYLVFYHGDGHRYKQFEATDALKTLRSADDGRTWREIASLPGRTTPEFVPVGDTLYAYLWDESTRQTSVRTSTDGETWSEPNDAYEPPFTFWGVTYDPASRMFWAPPHAIPHAGTAPEREIRLINSKDGIDWHYVSTVVPYDNASESTLRFEEDGTLVVLIRRKYGTSSTLAIAQSPYTDWKETEQPVIAEGEHFFEIGGQVFVASRANYTGGNAELLAQPDPFDKRRSYSMIYRFTADRELEPWAVMDSMGDCSYPFLVETPNEILCAYYSQHEDSVCKVYLCGYDF